MPSLTIFKCITHFEILFYVLNPFSNIFFLGTTKWGLHSLFKDHIRTGLEKLIKAI